MMKERVQESEDSRVQVKNRHSVLSGILLAAVLFLSLGHLATGILGPFEALAVDTVNEKSTWIVTCIFTDETGTPVTPASGTYRIDDDSGVQITGDTSFTPSGSTHTIVISPNENRILVAANLREFRRVTVTFVYGSGKQGTGEYRYNVVNLQGVQ